MAQDKISKLDVIERLREHPLYAALRSQRQ
jgi:hypothetical protein